MPQASVELRVAWLVVCLGPGWAALPRVNVRPAPLFDLPSHPPSASTASGQARASSNVGLSPLSPKSTHPFSLFNFWPAALPPAPSLMPLTQTSEPASLHASWLPSFPPIYWILQSLAFPPSLAFSSYDRSFLAFSILSSFLRFNRCGSRKVKRKFSVTRNSQKASNSQVTGVALTEKLATLAHGARLLQAVLAEQPTLPSLSFHNNHLGPRPLPSPAISTCEPNYHLIQSLWNSF